MELVELGEQVAGKLYPKGRRPPVPCSPALVISGGKLLRVLDERIRVFHARAEIAADGLRKSSRTLASYDSDALICAADLQRQT